MVIMGDVADVLGVADIRRSKWDILYEIVYIMGFELNSVKHAWTTWNYPWRCAGFQASTGTYDQMAGRWSSSRCISWTWGIFPPSDLKFSRPHENPTSLLACKSPFKHTCIMVIDSIDFQGHSINHDGSTTLWYDGQIFSLTFEVIRQFFEFAKISDISVPLQFFTLKPSNIWSWATLWIGREGVFLNLLPYWSIIQNSLAKLFDWKRTVRSW